MDVCVGPVHFNGLATAKRGKRAVNFYLCFGILVASAVSVWSLALGQEVVYIVLIQTDSVALIKNKSVTQRV